LGGGCTTYRPGPAYVEYFFFLLLAVRLCLRARTNCFTGIRTCCLRSWLLLVPNMLTSPYFFVSGDMSLLSARRYRPRHSLACRQVTMFSGLVQMSVSVQLTDHHIIVVTLRALSGLGPGSSGSASRQTVIQTQQENLHSVHLRSVTS